MNLILPPFQVQALLEDRLKRIVVPVKPQPTWGLMRPVIEHGWVWEYCHCAPSLRCPFEIGQRVGVKEEWFHGDAWYKNQKQNCYVEGRGYTWVDYKTDFRHDPDNPVNWKWRSPPSMPSWAIRLHFIPISIECKRVQELGDDEIVELGITPKIDAGIAGKLANESPEKMELWHYWNSTHLKPELKWEKSPWVWSIGIKKS